MFKRDAVIQVAILLAPIIVGLAVAVLAPLFLPSLRGPN